MARNVFNLGKGSSGPATIDVRLILLAAIAVAGLYIALWVVGDAVWQLSAKIDVMTQAFQSQKN